MKAPGSAFAQLDDPGDLERAQAFSQSRAADLELPSELALRRQALAGVQLAAGEHVPHLVHHFFESSRGANRLDAVDAHDAVKPRIGRLPGRSDADRAPIIGEVSAAKNPRLMQ
jgi:hypothetical protein